MKILKLLGKYKSFKYYSVREESQNWALTLVFVRIDLFGSWFSSSCRVLSLTYQEYQLIIFIHQAGTGLFYSRI